MYVDGFNLYHPIDQLGKSYLKWISLWRLGELLCDEARLGLVKVVLCTAVPKHMPDKRDRHNTFNAAQLAQGVVVIKGHHVPDPDRGGYSEKQSDIHVALSVILDGLDDIYDVAILLSADSDQVATARVFKDRLGPRGKRLIGATPLTRSFPTDYAGLSVSVMKVTEYHLEKSVMPSQVKGRKNTITRPASYAPPAAWVHPDDRPTAKAPKPPEKSAWSKGFKAR